MNNSQMALVSMGSNVEGAEQQLQQALEWLGSILTDLTHSGIYVSQSAGGHGQYHNVVARGYTTLTAEKFEALAKERETLAGRVRPGQEVALDIDLVRLGGSVIRPAELCRIYFLQGLELLDS